MFEEGISRNNKSKFENNVDILIANNKLFDAMVTLFQSILHSGYIFPN